MSIFKAQSPQIIPSFTGDPATGAGRPVPAGLTWYGRPYSTSIDVTAFNVPLPLGGRLYNLNVRTSGAHPADFPMTINLIVNGVATSLIVTVPVLAPSGTYFDLTHSVQVNPFDIVRYAIVNASAFPSGPIAGIYMLLGT